MVANRGSPTTPSTQPVLLNYSAMSTAENRMYASVADRAAGVRVVGWGPVKSDYLLVVTQPEALEKDSPAWHPNYGYHKWRRTY